MTHLFEFLNRLISFKIPMSVIDTLRGELQVLKSEVRTANEFLETRMDDLAHRLEALTGLVEGLLPADERRPTEDRPAVEGSMRSAGQITKTLPAKLERES